MADDPTRTDPPAGDPPSDPPQDPPADPKVDDLPADLGEAGKRAIEREREAAKAARAEAAAAKAEAQKLKDAQLSDQERKDKEAKEASTRAAAAEAKALKYEVAAAKGVPLTQAHRLQGSTKEELEQDAEAFLKDVKGGNGDTTFDGGARTTDDKPKSMDDAIRGARR